MLALALVIVALLMGILKKQCSFAVTMVRSFSHRSAAAVATFSIVATARRNLTWAKSRFGYFLYRHGRRRFNVWRRPYYSNQDATYMHAPYHWQYYGPQYANNLLPKHNYICGNYVGTPFLHLHTIYTLQFATSGVPIRVKRFPAVYDFTNPSRWYIGKELRCSVTNTPKLIDEGAISKAERLRAVKKGWLPA